MSTIQDVIDELAGNNTNLGAVADGLTSLKTDIDRVATLVKNLEGGQIATQAQVDALKTASDSQKASLTQIATALSDATASEGGIV